MSAEKENVFRTLRDEELLVTSFWCRFGIHKWTKFKDPERIKEGIWEYTVQKRSCASCNIHARKQINRY